MSGVWLLPSLNRSEQVKQFFESYTETESSTPVWILVDKNDPQREQYGKLEYPPNCKLVFTGAARTMGDKFRVIWDEVKNLEWVGILNDDHRPRTKGWDQEIIKHINGTNVVFCNDKWVFPQRICGAIAFSGKFLRTLGWIFPPGMQHLYSDDVWGFICNYAQCASGLSEVVVEHVHAYRDSKLQDETFALINGPEGLVTENGIAAGRGGYWIEDKKIFDHWMNSGQAQIDAQKIKDIQPKMGIMICTPSHDGNVAFEYACGLAETNVEFARRNVYLEIAKVVGSSLIPHSRNSLVDIFMKSRCQKLLFIDSDQGFNAMHVLRLLDSNKKIIAGITPHKRYPINLNFEPLVQDNQFFRDTCNKGIEEFVGFAAEKADQKGEIEVNRVGTGFIMIDRSVFDIMKDNVDEYEAFDSNPDVIHKEYFRMGTGTGPSKRFRGEDWHFTELAKELKIPIYINANVIVSHLGSHTFQTGFNLDQARHEHNKRKMLKEKADQKPQFEAV